MSDDIINDLIFASYGMLIAIAGVTVFRYAVYLKRKWHGWKTFTDPFFEVAIGVFGIALSTLLIRIWFQGWKTGEILGFNTKWMLYHPTVILIIIMPALFYTWHIRTITRKEYGEKFWVLSALFACVSFVLTYTFARIADQPSVSQGVSWLLDLFQ